MKNQRINDIDGYIQNKGSASINELCQVFDVSKNTIRRDLKQLLISGNFEKVYGGIALKSNTLVSFGNRQIENHRQKKMIAQEAAKLIVDNDLIFVDSGTTTNYLFDYVPADFQLVVVTNSLDIVNVCSERENIELIIVGSKYKRETRSFIEFKDDGMLKSLNIKKAFMAATGLSIQNGLTNSDMLETQLKKIIVNKADEIYLLADDSKFDRSTLITYAPLNKVNGVVSGGQIPAVYHQYFKEHSIQLYHSY